MAVDPRRNRSPRPLEENGLQQLALSYVGRYATSRSRVTDYLRRKLRERGWAGEGEPPVDRIVARLGELGYVDDRAFAGARAASLTRRGYGERRIRESLRAAGISDEDMAPAGEEARAVAWEAALRLAQRRRIGPFAASEPDRAGRERALGTLLRAGHSGSIARRIAFARPGEVPEPDEG